LVAERQDAVKDAKTALATYFEKKTANFNVVMGLKKKLVENGNHLAD
jgi:hypothetical protein